MPRENQTLRYTALYCRLSRDDGNDAESNSIVTQKILLSKYAADHGYGVTKFFVDDGYSGANFERPGFKEMLREAEAGKIGAIIVKDMSRFGRNYLEVGLYTEKIFPSLKIRFIAVNDGVDSNVAGSNEFTPFRNIINEWYCRDCSRKLKTSYRLRAEKGDHLSSFASYGYKIDPENKKMLIVDAYAASIVRRIFRMYLDGMSLAKIAEALNNEGVSAPREYKIEQGIPLSKGRTPIVERPCGWRQQSVRRIIDNYVYCGHSISLKTVTISYITHEKVPNAKENWIIVRNTHEAIIDEDTFAIAAKIRTLGKRSNKSLHDKGPLNLMVYCAECGARMYFHHYSGKGNQKNGGFICSSHAIYKNCTSSGMPRRILEKGVLANLRRITSIARDSEDEFYRIVGAERAEMNTPRMKKAREDSAKTESRIEEIDKIINRLFEQNVAGVLTDDRFRDMLAHYEKEQKDLRKKLDTLNIIMGKDNQEESAQRADKFLELVRKYTDITELTPEIVTAFIKKILVNKSWVNENGTREYSVVVEYNFIGSVTLPEAPVEEPIIEPKVDRGELLAKLVKYPEVRDYLIENDKITNKVVRGLSGISLECATKYLRKLCQAKVIGSSDPHHCGRVYDRLITPEELQNIVLDA